jgi:hypothetical protein
MDTPLVLWMLIGLSGLIILYSLLIGFRTAWVLNRVMQRRALYSLSDINRAISDAWQTSIRGFIWDWFIRAAGLAMLIVIPLIIAYGATASAEGRNDLNASSLTLVVGFIIALILYYVFQILLVVAAAYYVISFLTLLLKRFLIELRDDSRVRQRAVWWMIGLTSVGMFMQWLTIQSGLAFLGYAMKIMAFFLLLEQVRAIIPDDLGPYVERGGLAIYLGGLVLQAGAPVGWISRLGLLLEAIAALVMFGASFSSGSREDRLGLQWALALLFIVGAAVNVIAFAVPVSVPGITP